MGAFNQAKGLGGQLQGMGQGALNQGQGAFQSLQGNKEIYLKTLRLKTCIRQV